MTEATCVGTQPSAPPAQRRVLAVAATFTAEPLRRSLSFWMQTLAIDLAVQFAPYAQVMQQLLSPEGLLASNRGGINVLLIRLEDWIRDRADHGVERNVDHVGAAIDEFVAALELGQERSEVATFVFLCAPSRALPAAYLEPFERLQDELAGRLANLKQTWCLSHAELLRQYPLDEYEDVHTDRIAHIPYTAEYFAALATLLARRVAALKKPQYKVIAVDCDNTLWKGVVGEDGVAGIELTPAHLALQRTLVEQHDAGVLICLCSKNNPEDVAAVFAGRGDMVLREEHVVASRVNWSAKSGNLRSLAEELNLGLDSFVFIDDSAMECAEVRENCASVLTLQFPTLAADIEHFLAHVWAFDRLVVTADARRRTLQYRQNKERAAVLQQAVSLAGFLDSLQLCVEMQSMASEHLARVAELLQRTNQFNLTTIRRSASELAALDNAGEVEIRVVHVRDRFGDYGLVGCVLLRRRPAILEVDTFVLSCRVLGRRVEHTIVRELARIAHQEQRDTLVLPYRKSARNAPAWSFLERAFAPFRVPPADAMQPAECEFVVPVSFALQPFDESVLEVQAEPEVAEVASSSRAQTGAHQWHDASYQLSRIAAVMQAIDSAQARSSSQSDVYSAPATPMEQAVARIWSELLHCGPVSRDADFFALGGDSLLAVRAISRIGAELRLELPLSEFFAGPTPMALAQALSDAPPLLLPIERVRRDRALPLSWSQQRLWFIDQLEGGSLAYHVPIALRLQGSLDRVVLQASLQALLERHEALRTTFVKDAAGALQRISPDARFALKCVDLGNVAGDVVNRAVLQQMREDASERFDLGVDPMIRGRLLRLADAEHLLLITMHHIAADGWSIGLLIQELSVLYDAFRHGRQSPLPALPIQYADYAQWQRRWLGSEQSQRQLHYWQEQLRGVPALLELPSDRPRPAVQSYRGASVPVVLGTALTAELKALSRRFDCTLAMTLCAAWSIVLGKLSGQDDLVIGMPVANRRRVEVERLIGFFANTLAMRIDLGNAPSVAELLQRTRQTMLDAYAHQDVPFERVVETVQPVRDLSHNPIFQAMFAYQNTPRETVHLEGLKLTEREVPTQTAQFDLLLSVNDSERGIVGTLNYAVDLFDAGTIERWLGFFETVLAAMAAQPERSIANLPMMSDRERMALLQEFNSTQQPWPEDQTVHGLFEAQARRTPHATAVVWDGHALTYEQLDARANQLARYLRARGVGPDQVVAICVERSLEMIVGLLGILKAGAAYLPLDPNYPRERLDYMLRDAALNIVLTQASLRPLVPETGAALIALDEQSAQIAQFSSEPLPAGSARSLVYVIYTSGSTGRPKGIAMSHRSMANLIEWHRRTFGEGRRRVVQFAALSFDVAFQEIFSSLCTGALLVLLDEWVRRDPLALLQFLSSHSIERLFVPPLMLQSLAQTFLRTDSVLRGLEDVIAAGEQLCITPEIVNFCRRVGCRLHNHYGPTETHVVTALTLSGDAGDWPRLPSIGRPIDNTQIYILDAAGRPTPLGVIGEIHIAGANVARGYLHKPELTAQRFITDPVRAAADARMYKTGDIGRWRADGTIEYLGRNDDQVKIRGFRIELSEIEAQLARHPAVKEVAVIVRNDSPGEKRLVAYLTLHEHESLNTQELRPYLSARLPEHMVPSAFVSIERMPVTPSGKLDRRSLPKPELDAYSIGDYRPPEDEVERLLAEVWSELLHVERVGRDDNFFELGGHSLLAVRVTARIEAAFSVDVPIRALFEHPTMSQLAAQVQELRRLRLLDSLAGGGETEALLESVATMSEHDVQELLYELKAGGRK